MTLTARDACGLRLQGRKHSSFGYALVEIKMRARLGSNPKFSCSVAPSQHGARERRQDRLRDMQKLPPRLFDRRLLSRRLARALDEGAPDFLIARAAEDLEDRLAAIKREFPRALDLGTPSAHFARALATPQRPAPLRAALTLGAKEQGLRIVADEEALPLAPGSLDLVVSGLALQW